MTEIIERVAPDLVHIHGTEYPHAEAAAIASLSAGVPSVVSIQGLMGPYAEAFYHGIPAVTRYGFTVRDLVRRQNTRQHRTHFLRQGETEQRVIEQVSATIGRTLWDKSCIQAINPDIPYFHCDETLRPPFYGPKWSLSGAKPHTIFLSQGAYPIKGAHVAIRALPLILRQFPHAELVVAGHDPTHSASKLPGLRRTSYGAYVNSLIRKLGLRNHVRFVGVLDQTQMLETFLRSHVYLSASSIENSPNSLAEAMMLGVPTVASYVGGVPSMTDESVTYFFAAGDHRMLASSVCKVFSGAPDSTQREQRSRDRALATHDPQMNARRLSEIYSEVLNA
ncbi:glycosyltransferase family 4 protein [Dietzia sp. SLG510A3-3B2-2]|nr:glycosyltransferase family 4 protein [Dietzia sp. SLG510A3-40A3]MBB1008813.1 glycosyltransferase family 4 protein [Dietzia sp. SLG510A3-3B2-2]